MSKSEERLRRKNQKALKNKDSNARLAQSIGISSGVIRTHIVPDITKIPRTVVDYSSYKNHALSWSIERADLLGSWSWGEARQWSDDEYSITIEPHFKALENNSWQQIEIQTYNGNAGYRRLLNKRQSLESICVEAQERWQELDTISQFDQLFRFRLGSLKRAWGVRVLYHFFLVWYERYHRICPSNTDD